MSRLRFVIASWCLAASWLGCNALLGNESAVFEPPEASLDGSSPDDASPDAFSPDGDAVDGGSEARCDDISSNPHHCGRCGHDCRGGTCAAGQCQPVVLTVDRGRPIAIALDATHVYWNNQETGDIRRTPIGGGAVELLYDGPEGVLPGDEFAVHEGNIYFTPGVADAGVVRCPVTGCNGSPSPILPSLENARAVTIDGDTLRYVESGPEGSVGTCVLPCAQHVQIATKESFPQRVTGAGNVHAWTTLFGAVRVKTGTSPPIGINVPNPTAIAIVDGLIVYADRAGGPFVMQLDGGARRQLRPGQPTQTAYLAIEGTQIFFADHVTDGRILTCPVGGCDGGVVATGQRGASAVAVDSNNIYWTNEGSGGDSEGQVMRVAR